ncbi:hypothetical protein Dimus_032292 [Dionaea muscipula]
MGELAVVAAAAGPPAATTNSASPPLSLLERLKDYKQENILSLWDDLSPQERNLLVDDIENINLPRIDRIIRCSLEYHGLPVSNRGSTGDDGVYCGGEDGSDERKVVEYGVG